MAERKLTKSEERLKKRNPKRFAELMAIREKSKGKRKLGKMPEKVEPVSSKVRPSGGLKRASMVPERPKDKTKVIKPVKPSKPSLPLKSTGRKTGVIKKDSAENVNKALDIYSKRYDAPKSKKARQLMADALGFGLPAAKAALAVNAVIKATKGPVTKAIFGKAITGGEGNIQKGVPLTNVEKLSAKKLRENILGSTAVAGTYGVLRKSENKDNLDKIMSRKNKTKPKVVSAPLPKPKPKRKSKIKDFTDVNEIDYDTNKDEGNGTEERKSLGEAMFGGFKTGDFTPKDQIVKNPFTGEDMELKYEYPDDPDDGMKKGGSIKKNMKKKKAKTKAKKRIALRGYGAALRGF